MCVEEIMTVSLAPLENELYWWLVFLLPLLLCGFLTWWWLSAFQQSEFPDKLLLSSNIYSDFNNEDTDYIHSHRSVVVDGKRLAEDSDLDDDEDLCECFTMANSSFIGNVSQYLSDTVSWLSPKSKTQDKEKNKYAFRRQFRTTNKALPFSNVDENASPADLNHSYSGPSRPKYSDDGPKVSLTRRTSLRVTRSSSFRNSPQSSKLESPLPPDISLTSALSKIPFNKNTFHHDHSMGNTSWNMNNQSSEMSMRSPQPLHHFGTVPHVRLQPSKRYSLDLKSVREVRSPVTVKVNKASSRRQITKIGGEPTRQMEDKVSVLEALKAISESRKRHISQTSDDDETAMLPPVSSTPDRPAKRRRQLEDEAPGIIHYNPVTCAMEFTPSAAPPNRVAPLAQHPRLPYQNTQFQPMPMGSGLPQMSMSGMTMPRFAYIPSIYDSPYNPPPPPPPPPPTASSGLPHESRTCKKKISGQSSILSSLSSTKRRRDKEFMDESRRSKRRSTGLNLTGATDTSFNGQDTSLSFQAVKQSMEPELTSSSAKQSEVTVGKKAFTPLRKRIRGSVQKSPTGLVEIDEADEERRTRVKAALENRRKDETASTAHVELLDDLLFTDEADREKASNAKIGSVAPNVVATSASVVPIVTSSVSSLLSKSGVSTNAATTPSLTVTVTPPPTAQASVAPTRTTTSVLAALVAGTDTSGSVASTAASTIISTTSAVGTTSTVGTSAGAATFSSGTSTTNNQGAGTTFTFGGQSATSTASVGQSTASFAAPTTTSNQSGFVMGAQPIASTGAGDTLGFSVLKTVSSTMPSALPQQGAATSGFAFATTTSATPASSGTTLSTTQNQFGFGTTSSTSASTAPGFAFGTSVGATKSSSTTSASTTAAAQGAFAFNSSTAATKSASIGSTAPASGAFAFGATAKTQASPVPPTGLGFGTLASSTTTAPQTGFGTFNTTSASTTNAGFAGGLNFSTNASTTNAGLSGGLNFSTSASTTNAGFAGGLNFSTNASTTNTGLAAGLNFSATKPSTTGFAFNPSAPASASPFGAAGASATGSFGTTGASASTTGSFGATRRAPTPAFNFGTTPATTASSAGGSSIFGATNAGPVFGGSNAGTTAPKTTSSFAFGSTAPSSGGQAVASVFGGGVAKAASTGGFNFGVTPATTTNAGTIPSYGFTFSASSGQPPPPYGATQAPSGGFGGTKPTSGGGVFNFGAKASGEATQAVEPSKPSIFGGASNTNSSTSVFGASQPSPFGASTNQKTAFGASTNQVSTTGFGASQPSPFGASTNQKTAFGASTNQSSVFGAASTTPSPFGAFGQSATTTQAPSVFGGASANQSVASIFGQSQGPKQQTLSVTNNPPAFGSTNQQSSGFNFGATAGQQQQQSGAPPSGGFNFSAAAKPAASSGFSFGGSSAVTTPAFAASSPAQPVQFGSPATPGAFSIGTGDAKARPTRTAVRRRRKP